MAESKRRIWKRLWPAVGIILMGLPAGVTGQERLPSADATGQEGVWRLTLEDAVALARNNNPQYLQAEQEVGVADWRVREAYAAFLPSASTSVGFRYVGAGTQTFGVFTGADIGVGTTDYYLSDYSLNLNYSLGAETFFGLSGRRADREAAEARLAAAAYDLESRVTVQYLAGLRASDAVEVARRQLERAEQSLELASARAAAGAVPGTDLRQAEVERGRAEVALVRAENEDRIQRFRLLEEVGVHDPRRLELVNAFSVFEPGWPVGELVALALESNPSIRSARSRERAGVAGMREARSSYLPSLTANVGWSGFTRQVGDSEYLLGQARGSVESQRSNCMFFNEISSGLSQPLEGYPRDCGGIVLTPEDESRIVQSNDVFPFDFERQPVSAGLRVSIPIFQGLSRQRRVEEAESSARTARHAMRAEELRLRTAVTTADANLDAAYRVVEIESRNQELAAEQLELARERYSLGAAPFLDLLTAQESLAAADRDYLNAIYDFHAALVELERATGRELRDGTPSLD